MLNRWPIKRSIFSLCFVVGLFALHVSVTHAADYTIDRFDSDISVNADGSLDVQESIEVNFLVPRHGLYRVIPTTYQTDDGQREIIQIDQATVSDGNGNEVASDVSDQQAFQVRMGDPARTVLGENLYVLHYHVQGALRSFNGTDDLYWNVTGTEWDTTPTEVSAHVHLPPGVVLNGKDLSYACYTGVAGSVAHDCTAAMVGQTLMVGASQEFLTIGFGWPSGLVTVPPPLPDTSRGFPFSLGGTSYGEAKGWLLLLAVLLPLGTFIFMFRRWYRYGRDPRGRGTIVAQYEPPKGLLAAPMGMVWHNRVDSQALSAAIVELAVKGYIKIVEKTIERFGPDRQTFLLQKVKVADDGLQEWEKKLLDVLFVGGMTEVDEDALKRSFAAQKSTVIDAIEQSVVVQGYLADRPIKACGPWMILGAALMFVGLSLVTVLYGFLGMALMLSGAIISAFGFFMSRRTALGVEAMEQTKGFKLFLETAEKYRLQWQEKEGVFEKYLPYAMVFGVADKWAKAFASLQINPPQPNWYVGSSLMAFNAMDFSSRMNALSRQMAVVAAPKGSGSSGGGFSGGGFGGGGGGSW